MDSVAQSHSDAALSVAFVRFGPGARTAWHSHSVAQTLYVTEGEGRIQTRGGAPVAIRAGDVVVASANEWHWHGAAGDHFMTHLAVSEGEVSWGEQVSESEYRVAAD
ncbi:cupin domain-containing protein [Streptomyces sp. NPDC090088]|uniref:cupin domain-containing protein n=1 Tax=Streptomyces sp. NPDC090088 TaxID=3365944 RepID=UPI0037F9F977